MPRVDVNNYTETKGRKKSQKASKYWANAGTVKIAHFDARKSTLILRARSFAA
jgi:hypothetical protein